MSVLFNTFNEADLNALLSKHPKIPGASIAIMHNYEVTPVTAGYARVKGHESFTSSHFMQCASLSKTVAAAFALEYFCAKGIPMTTSVNEVLQSINAKWTIESGPAIDGSAANNVTLSMLVNHTALGMHYVYGIPLTAEHQPTPLELISGAAKSFGYERLLLERLPGTKMAYSGGGFVVLQYLLEEMEQQSIDVITRDFLDRTGLKDFVFTQLNSPLDTRFAYGHITPEQEVPALAFPPLAAGGLCTPSALATFLCHLAKAYSNPEGSGGISHLTARAMMAEEALLDLGAKDFMGAKVSQTLNLVLGKEFYLLCCFMWVFSLLIRLVWVSLLPVLGQQIALSCIRRRMMDSAVCICSVSRALMRGKAL